MNQTALPERHPSRSLRLLLLLLGLAAVLALPASSLYYEYSGGKACARCHEIWQPYTDWHTSAHRNIPCSTCHGGILTLEAGFHLKNLHRVITHLRGRAPEQVRLRTHDNFKLNETCRKCHQREWAAWSASLHSATYNEIFLDPKHNRQQRLIDDCFRCHGMHYEGGIRDLVTPVDTTGPWKLIHADLGERPAILCLSCHQMHRQGTPLTRPAAKRTTSADEALHPSSLALFDRRELAHVPVDQLPLPEMHEKERRVKISPDGRQALCYQCHAPLADQQVASGDDRTPTGVHEGLSCLACHTNHGETTRASCAGCHPRLSNCGLDVEKMDTSFKSTRSPHNIHFVKCLDCHPKGVPKKRTDARPVQAASGL